MVGGANSNSRDHVRSVSPASRTVIPTRLERRGETNLWESKFCLPSCIPKDNLCVRCTYARKYTCNKVPLDVKVSYFLFFSIFFQDISRYCNDSTKNLF